MRTFKNNNRRSRYRSNDRNYKRNGEAQKFNSEFSPSSNFQRRFPGKNNHNAPKLIEKYNDLAREALSNGDKILSENYLQYADHFTRVLNERESYRREKSIQEKAEVNGVTANQLSDSNDISDKNLDDNLSKETKTETPVEAS